MPLALLETTLTAEQFFTPPTGLPALTRIEFGPTEALMSDRATQRFTAKGFDQYGKPVPVTPMWSGARPGQGRRGRPVYPRWRRQPRGPSHRCRGDGGRRRRHRVGGGGRIAPGHLHRTAARPVAPGTKLAAGGALRLQAEMRDQFGARYTLPITWTASGSVQVAPDGRITAGQGGDGSFAAEAGG